MLSPFAPLHPWLCKALGSTFVRLENGGLYSAHDAIAKRMDANLCDLQTRAAILRALADAGHPRPWALGAPWSLLTDEQAGRVTAEIVRAVVEDPSKPVGVVPVAIAQRYPTEIVTIHGDCRIRIEYHAARNRLKVWAQNQLEFRPAENADEMITVARALGCIMIEDITP